MSVDVLAMTNKLSSELNCSFSNVWLKFFLNGAIKVSSNVPLLVTMKTFPLASADGAAPPC
jgi:hypothetical protein